MVADAEPRSHHARPWTDSRNAHVPLGRHVDDEVGVERIFVGSRGGAALDGGKGDEPCVTDFEPVVRADGVEGLESLEGYGRRRERIVVITDHGQTRVGIGRELVLRAGDTVAGLRRRGGPQRIGRADDAATRVGDLERGRQIPFEGDP